MSPTLREDAHAVLLPATDRLELSDSLRRFLGAGGVSVLLGESRAEYLARAMSPERLRQETAEDFVALAAEVRARAGASLIAVDQELGGICRLQGLVPDWPDAAALPTMSDTHLAQAAAQVARAARALGPNVFLAPIVDTVTGENPWLQGRVVSTDPDQIARVSAAFVRGVQAAGVAATAKHFPGFAHIPLDPAIESAARETSPRADVEAGLAPFRAVIAAEVELVMVGPAVVTALDPDRPALRAPRVVDLLRSDLGFSGIVLADDLDSPATLRGDSLAEGAVDALTAGCDYLLLADIGTHLEEVADAIVAAVARGTLSAEALARSAAKVRDLANRYDQGR